MQFFGIGLFELVMVLLVSLLVVGPDRLPQTAREIGKVVRSLRRYANSVRNEVLEGFNELTEEVEATRSEFRDLETSLRASQTEIERELRETSRAAEQGEFVDSEASPDMPRAGRGRNGARAGSSTQPVRPQTTDSDAG
jgi:sec-independent protein translocase protein TatB